MMSVVLGRLLQIGGMILLPIGLWYGLARDEVRFEVFILAVGGMLFLIGRALVEKR